MINVVLYHQLKLKALEAIQFKAYVARDVNSNSCLKRPWLYKKAEIDIKYYGREIRRHKKIIREYKKNEKSLQCKKRKDV